MILFGASGHAKVIVDICQLNQIEISRIWDDNKDLKELLGYSVELPKNNIPEGEEIIISVGNNETRKRIVESNYYDYGVAIHPSSDIDGTVSIDGGSVVMAGAILNSSTIVGKHCIVNTGAKVDHDCCLENYVHISPNATLCGTIYVGEGTQVGAGATILPNLTIGKWCKIGAGAVITKDVPDRSVVVGNPGRIIRRISKEPL